jgi:hypothetical protein
MKVLKQHIVLIPLVIGMLGLAAACSSQTPAPDSRQVSASATQATTSAAQSASMAASLVPTTVAAQPGTPSASGAQAPVRIASALAVASAIAKPGASQASATKIDPCLLVTRDAAEAAAKTTLAELRQYNDAAGPTCEYASDSSEVSVTITALSSGGGTVYDGSSSTYGQTRTEVAGVGDKAFVVKGQRVIYVLKGDTMLTVQLVSLKMSGDETAAALTALAKTAVTHL